MATVVELEKYEGFICESCEAHVEEPESPLYECGNCSMRFTRSYSANDNHQCPQCKKMSSKVADRGCDECGEGELLDFIGWHCESCDGYFEGEEEPDHDCVRDEKLRQKKLKTDLEELVNRIDIVPASEIVAGDEIYTPDSNEDKPELYFSGRPKFPLKVYRVDTKTNEVVISFGGMALRTDPTFNVFRLKPEYHFYKETISG